MRKLPNHSSRVFHSPPGWPEPYEITVTPPMIEFGAVLRYSSSTVLQATVTNTGKFPVVIGDITASGDFGVSEDAPEVLLPGKHFLLNITFQPKRTGTQTGSVYVDTGDAAGTEFVKLLGRGYVGEGGGGEEPPDGEGVVPQYWRGLGDGVSKDFPLEGADVFNSLFYDTAMEETVGSKDYLVVKPTDFLILEGEDGVPPVIRFVLAPAENQEWFTTCRGYAKPWSGPPPIDTVSPGIITEIIENNTIIDGRYRNTLILINTSTPFNLRIRKNTDNEELDWKPGDFFSVVQQGQGPITLLMEDGAAVTPPKDFIARSRAQNCVISASCTFPDGDGWLASGDLLRVTSTSDKSVVTLVDRTVLIGSSMTAGTNKDSYHMPYGMKLDPIIDGGVFASLMMAQTDGNIFTVDLLRNGASILVNKLVINNNTKSSKVAITPATYAVGGDTLQQGDEITMSITQIGNGTARGVRAYLVGNRV